LKVLARRLFQQNLARFSKCDLRDLGSAFKILQVTQDLQEWMGQEANFLKEENV